MAVNSAPINYVPGTQIVQANTSEALDRFAIADFDVGSGTMTTTLSVAHGTLSVEASGSVGIAGNDTAAVTLTGTLDEINTALATLGNLTYHGNQDFFGDDTLTITTSDNGNSGTGGALTDTDQVTIRVKSLITGTAGDDTFAALPGQERIDAGDGIDTVSFNFKLSDATVSHPGNTTVIDGPAGSHTVMTGVEVFNFADTAVNTTHGDLLLDGRQTSVQGAGEATILLGGDRIAPNGFDYTYYLLHNPDVAAAGIDPLQHFETYGWKEGRDPNPYFDTAGYLAHYADVKASGINPFDHYVTVGWQEGRDPSLAFDTAAYLAANPDVAAAHVNPLVHFLVDGIHEGRHAFADATWG